MKNALKSALAALALAAAAVPASAQNLDQLIASAGLTRSEAAGMTLSQIAAHKFNRDVSGADRQTVPGSVVASASASGTATFARNVGLSTRGMPTPSLTELAARHFNRGVSYADQQTVTRPIPGSGSDRSQLAASAGLGPDGASGRTLTEIAGHFFNRGVSVADQQTIKR